MATLEWQKVVKMADFHEKSPKTQWRGCGKGFIEVPIRMSDETEVGSAEEQPIEG